MFSPRATGVKIFWISNSDAPKVHLQAVFPCESRLTHKVPFVPFPFLFVPSAFFRGQFVPLFFQAIEFVLRQLDALVQRIWRVVIRTARIRREKTQKTQKGREQPTGQ